MIKGGYIIMDDLKLNEQLKKYRREYAFSQEELAEKLFVSRQTISNWENKRSFPDIHNLLLLSVLFDVSLDNLVKGEVGEMKNVSAAKTYKRISMMRDIFAMVCVFLMIFGRHFFGEFFSVIMGVAAIVAMIAGKLSLKNIEKQNNINNTIYDPKEAEEILFFLENRNLSEAEFEKKKRENMKNQKFKWFFVLVFFVSFIIVSAYISQIMVR